MEKPDQEERKFEPMGNINELTEAPNVQFLSANGLKLLNANWNCAHKSFVETVFSQTKEAKTRCIHVRVTNQQWN